MSVIDSTSQGSVCFGMTSYVKVADAYGNPLRMQNVNPRGGVEDTRLEAKAKAKDTKKIRGQGQGQGQPFRGQALSRPRTGMLEAKAKDRGHSR